MISLVLNLQKLFQQSPFDNADASEFIPSGGEGWGFVMMMNMKNI